jgi:cell division protease FtsH
VEQAYRRAKVVLTENRLVLNALADMLIERETVDSEELQELLATSDVKMASVA